VLMLYFVREQQQRWRSCYGWTAEEPGGKVTTVSRRARFSTHRPFYQGSGSVRQFKNEHIGGRAPATPAVGASKPAGLEHFWKKNVFLVFCLFDRLP